MKAETGSKINTITTFHAYSYPDMLNWITWKTHTNSGKRLMAELCCPGELSSHGDAPKQG